MLDRLYYSLSNGLFYNIGYADLDINIHFKMNEMITA